MAPRRAVLQQHRHRAVGSGGPQQQARGAESPPVVVAFRGHHPPVAVPMHALNNKPQTETTYQLVDLTPRVTEMLLEFAYTVGMSPGKRKRETRSAQGDG